MGTSTNRRAAHDGRTGGRGRVTLGALLLLAGAGCASSGASEPSAPSASSVNGDAATVLVANHGLSAVAIYATYTAARLGTVMPGETRCLRLWPTSDIEQLTARPVGGGTNTVSPPFDARLGSGWDWTLSHTPSVDGLSLVQDNPCVA